MRRQQNTTDDLSARLVYYKTDMRPLLGLALRTVDKRISQGRFPKPDFLEGNRQAWRRDTITRWLDSMSSGKVVA